MIVNHLFPVNQTIDSVFAPENLGPDCMWMAHLMGPVENAIEQYLYDGEYQEAVTMFLQLTDSLCYHFVKDEHWCYFDDMYHPTYNMDANWELLRDFLKKFPDELFDELEEGLIDLSQTEACQGYGCPSIENWLDDMKAMYQ